MFTNQARVLVCISLLLVAGLAAFFKVYEISALSGMFIGVVIWGYYKEGPLVLAAKQFKLKNYEKSLALLSSIKNPGLLNKRKKPYYYFLLGSIAINRLDYENAELNLGQAAIGGLRANDLGVVLMHLANISLRNHDKEKGMVWINQAEKLPLTAKYKSILGNIEKELRNIK
ncbi:MAG: tetratricopeptide repeat protein [Oligoflexus sp.]|nr:tetratricopeptide repeat protein [Pseudopedobacter sp.]